MPTPRKRSAWVSPEAIHLARGVGYTHWRRFARRQGMAQAL